MIFTLADTHKKIKNAEDLAKHSMPIVTIKTNSSQALPNGSIDFSELINIAGKI